MNDWKSDNHYVGRDVTMHATHKAGEGVTFWFRGPVFASLVAAAVEFIEWMPSVGISDEGVTVDSEWDDELWTSVTTDLERGGQIVAIRDPDDRNSRLMNEFRFGDQFSRGFDYSIGLRKD